MKIVHLRQLLMTVAIMTVAVAHSQELKDVVMNRNFEKQVKTLDEFMMRFNGQEAFPGLKKTDTDFRKKNLYSLFDFDIPQHEKYKTVDFVTTIIDNNIMLNFEDSLWYAVAECSVNYKNKTERIKLILHTENVEGNKYKWVFCGADGIDKFFRKGNTANISPVEHEIHFMELQNIFKNDRKNIFGYAERGWHADQLTELLTLAKAGLVNFETVQELKFIFFSVPGYTFTLEENIRKGSNSGWLITKIEKTDNSEKNVHINKLLGKAL